MLVGDEHGSARETGEERTPDVGAELVTVQDVGPVVSQKPKERPPRAEVELGGAIELEHANTGGFDLVEERRGRRPRHAERAIEPRRIEPRDHVCGDLFASPAAEQAVDDGDDADHRRARRDG